MAQVTQTRAPAGTRPLGAPTPSSVDLGAAGRWGLLGGLAAVFVSAIGMVESFAGREILNPVLTLGYLVLALVPFTFGYVAGRPPPPRAGMPAARRGPRNVAAGLVAGLVTGALLAAFASLASAGLRGVFVNVTPTLLDDILLLGRGAGLGSALLVAGGGILGAFGGAVHVIPGRWRGATLTALLWVVTFGLLRDLMLQIVRGVGLGGLSGVLYAPAGGLRPGAAVGVAVVLFAAQTLAGSRRATLRPRFAALPQAQRRAWLAVGIAAIVVVLALAPVVLGTFMSEILDLVGIFLLMAIGLNIVLGYAGLLDLGYVAFFAVGAYATAVLTSPDSGVFAPQLAFWTAIPFVVLAAAFAGLVVGTPVLRMRGDYLAIVTLGFGEIARILFLSDWLEPVFGGAQGITRIPGVQIGATELNTPPEFFYPIAVLVVLAAYASWALYHSRIGRAWVAVREDEPVAEALGVNIVTAKLSAFVIGAILASFGGAVFASKIGAIFPNSFSIVVSIIVVVIIIVGGMGSLPGVALGALVIQGIPQLLREFEEFQFLLYGALLIFMMQARPEGLIPSKQRAQELHQDEVMQDAWLNREADHEDREASTRSPEASPEGGLI